MSTKQSGPTLRRTRARVQVMQILFMYDFVEVASSTNEVAKGVSEVMDGVVIEPYAVELFKGIKENIEQIDKIIEEASENWSISRMAITDRSILRIAVYEMFFRPDIPLGVSINEAVELAQSFGGEDDSYRFVNGILGRVATQLDEDLKNQE